MGFKDWSPDFAHFSINPVHLFGSAKSPGDRGYADRPRAVEKATVGAVALFELDPDCCGPRKASRALPRAF
jgi:hypothetical protein